MATRIKFETAVMPTDDSTFDVTVSGETRTPVGVVVWGSNASSLDSDTNNAQLSMGVSDFTTMACCSSNSEDGVGASDVSREHRSDRIYNRNDPGTSSVIRSITGVSAITGGVRFTPGQASGLAMRIIVMLVFGTECKAFTSRGDGNLAVNETFAITHGLTNAPKAGLFACNEAHEQSQGTYITSYGFASMDGSIKQGGYSIRQANGQSTTDIDGRVFDTRVGMRVTGASGESFGFELTANNATTTTFTNRIAAHTTSLIGLLIEADDIGVDMVIVDTPASASADWNYNSLSWKSQAVVFGMSSMNNLNASSGGQPAGSHGIAVVDNDDKHASAAVWIENNRDATTINTETGSRFSDTDIYLPRDDNGFTEFDFDSLTFTTDGWDVLNTPFRDSEAAKWPTLAFQEESDPIVIPVPTGPQY